MKRAGLIFLFFYAGLWAAPVEWGGEASLGVGVLSATEEQIFIRDESNSSAPESAATVNGSRTKVLLNLEAYYQNFAIQLQPQFYLANKGEYNFRTGNVDSIEARQNFEFSSISDFSTLLKYRVFAYGQRPIFTLNFGYKVRSANGFDVVTSPYNGLASETTNNYFLLGFSLEPILYTFGRFELTLPVNFVFGPGHRSGSHLLAAFTEDDQFMAAFDLGLRVSYEPRGPFLYVQGSFSGYMQPYGSVYKRTELSSVENYLVVGAGYFYRDTVFNQVR